MKDRVGFKFNVKFIKKTYSSKEDIKKQKYRRYK